MPDYKICPYCTESIKKEAIKCRYCKEWLTDGNELNNNPVQSKDRADASSNLPVATAGANDTQEKKYPGMKIIVSKLKLLHVAGHPNLKNNSTVIIERPEKQKRDFFDKLRKFDFGPSELQDIILFQGSWLGLAIPLAEHHIEDVKNILLVNQSEASLSKAAVGGAAGLLLAGPIVGLLGAAYGGRKHDKSFIQMTLRYNERDTNVYFANLKDAIFDINEKYTELVRLVYGDG